MQFPKKFIKSVREKLVSGYKDNWHNTASGFSSLDTYVLYKKEHKPEDYFCLVKNKRHLSCYVRFRLHAHSLEIERGRYVGLSREQRLCKCCDRGEIEDERHFLLSCSAFSQLRGSYIQTCYRNAPTAMGTM